MHRRFSTHVIRPVIDLAGIWDFAFLGEVDPDAVEVSRIRFTDRMAVPACFDATPAYAGRRGLVAYRTSVTAPEAARYRLVFDSVQLWARVLVNGRVVAEHPNGFTQFHADIAHVPGGVLDIVVLVDNRLDSLRAPLHLDYYDWYHYGGIARGVELHVLGEVAIDRIAAVTTDWRSRTVELTVHYSGSMPGATEFTVECDGRTILGKTVCLNQSRGHFVERLTLPEAALWSPQAPNLHVLRVRLGDDDLAQRIGIRQVAVRGREICINDEPLRLLGFNRHEAHPQFGHTTPEALLLADLQQFHDLGCNFLRGSHYPQDQQLLDLCDEMGICVWCEGIGWNNDQRHLRDDHFVSAQRRHLEEMIHQSINHPSIVLWGLLNESASDRPDCRATYEELIGLVRRLDSSRPVTYASNRPMKDICYDLADVVSANVYPGWYEGNIEQIPGELDKLIAHIDRSGWSRKPVIVSEIGAGAIPGWRDWNGAMWTEQYQAQLLETVIGHLFMDRDRVAGLAIWLFNDFRTTQEQSRLLMRPRSFNDKGIVDEYRRPKLAYQTVKALFHRLRKEAGQLLPNPADLRVPGAHGKTSN